ncbi:hypothetical protein CC2G_014718 [Coprinopsis cinerea AmutBmut pab1-1]|nr:hypothetical protein CC2G_014718 [Coprinopsis cinerea AmutBmut pab1-1]
MYKARCTCRGVWTADASRRHLASTALETHPKPLTVPMLRMRGTHRRPAADHAARHCSVAAIAERHWNDSATT